MSTSKVDPTKPESLIEGAHRYAAADPSDPFALARALAHINQGLCNRIFLKSGAPHDGHYDAESQSIVSYGVVTQVWKNRTRP